MPPLLLVSQYQLTSPTSLGLGFSGHSKSAIFFSLPDHLSFVLVCSYSIWLSGCFWLITTQVSCFLCFSPVRGCPPCGRSLMCVWLLVDALLRGGRVAGQHLHLSPFLWIKLLIVRSYPQPPSIIPLLKNIFIVVIFALDPLQEGCAAYKKERWSELIGKF